MNSPCLFLLITISTINCVNIFSSDFVIAGSGDTVHPTVATNIAMSKEKITIDFDNAWTVCVEYTFDNQDVLVDLPIVLVSKNTARRLNDLRWNGELKDLTVVANGVPLAIQRSELNSEDSYLFQMQFNKGLNVLRLTYSIAGGIIADPRSYRLDYRLKTSTNWVGPIGELDINILFQKPVFIIKSNDFFIVSGINKKGISSTNESYTFIKRGKLSFSDRGFYPNQDIVMTPTVNRGQCRLMPISS